MNTRAQNLVLALFLAALWLIAPQRADACSCMAQSLDEARRSACVLFEGQVLAVEPIDAQGDIAPMHVRVRFKVIQTWTPGIAEQTTITTASNSAACGYNFEVGQSYLVFADGGNTEAPVVSLCGGTKLREQADEDVRALGMGVVPVSPSQPTATSSTTVQQAGCASCSVGSGPSRPANLTMLWVLTLCLLAWRGLARL